jgi:transcriptional regulator with XRE-family HTH domain
LTVGQRAGDPVSPDAGPNAILGDMSIERRIATPRRSERTTTGRLCREIHVSIGHEIKRMRLDAGLSQRELAQRGGIDNGFLSLVERGLREPSLAVLVAIATALGGTISVRLYPGTGPRLRDPIQARITEALIKILHPRWTAWSRYPSIGRPAA